MKTIQSALLMFKYLDFGFSKTELLHFRSFFQIQTSRLSK